MDVVGISCPQAPTSPNTVTAATVAWVRISTSCA
jgi:hypothetical protein